MEGDHTINASRLIRSVKALPPTTLELTFSTGEKLYADVSRLIKRFKLYAPLANPEFFAQTSIAPWGHAVQWPNDIDMSVDQLYEIACEQIGTWSHTHFNAWMQKNGLSLNRAADALGMTKRMVTHYRMGNRSIPKVVQLACKGGEQSHAA